MLQLFAAECVRRRQPTSYYYFRKNNHIPAEKDTKRQLAAAGDTYNVL